MDDKLSDMIDVTEEESLHICEKCGSKDDTGMVVSGWNQTLCFDCFVELAKKKERPIVWWRNNDKKYYWVYDDGSKEEY